METDHLGGGSGSEPSPLLSDELARGVSPHRPDLGGRRSKRLAYFFFFFVAAFGFAAAFDVVFFAFFLAVIGM